MKVLLFSIFFLVMAGQGIGQTELSTESTFVVPKDEAIPVDELSLLLTPLTRDDLAQEVALWQELLQKKLHTISNVQIIMKYLNRDIQVFEATQNGLATFMSASQAVNEHLATALGDTTQAAEDKRRDLAQALLEARFHLSDAVTLALSREAEAFQISNLEVIVRDAMELLTTYGKSDDYLEFANVDLGLANYHAQLSESGEEFDPNNEELMTAVIADVAEILRKKAGVRDLVVEYLAILMEDRGELVKRVRMVISEWEKKGATPEDLELIRIFVDDVTRIQLDVADQATRWSLLKLWIQSDEGGIKVAKGVGRFLGMLLFSALLAMLGGTITSKALHRTHNISQLMRDFVIRSIRRVIFLVGFMMSLSLLGVNVGPILGVVGAAGFVLAFALQSTLGNFASGIMIMIYKPFDVGDAIDASGVKGVVKTMNLTSTIINTFDNKLVIVPNNSIWGGVITNITGSQTRRIDLVFRISYGDDTDLAEKIIHEVLAKQEFILDDPEPTIKMHELSDFTVNFICRPWVKTTDYWNVRWELTRKIRERFSQAGFAAPVDPGAFIKRMGGPQK